MRPRPEPCDPEREAGFADQIAAVCGFDTELEHRGATAGNSPVSGQARTPDPYPNGERLESSPRETVSEHGTGHDPVPQNPYAEAARLKKCGALVVVLKGVTADLASKASLAAWAEAAEKAGVRMPSATTRALVIERLRELEEGF